MSFDIRLIWNGRKGSVTNMSDITFTEVYRAVGDLSDKVTGADTLYNALGIVLGDSHPSNPLAICTDIDATNDQQDPRIWTITLKYQTATGTTDKPKDHNTPQQFSEPNPTLRPPVIKVGVKKYTYAVKQDLEQPNPRPLINRAGQPFLPPYQLETCNLVYTMSFYHSQFRDAIAGAQVDKVNTDTFFGWPPNTLKIINAEIHGEFSNGEVVYQETWQIEKAGKGQTFNFATQYWEWNPVRIANMGWNELKDPLDGNVDANKLNFDPKNLRAIQINGVPTFFWLDDNGKMLEKNGEFKYLPFTLYETTSFSSFLP